MEACPHAARGHELIHGMSEEADDAIMCGRTHRGGGKDPVDFLQRLSVGLRQPEPAAKVRRTGTPVENFAKQVAAE